MRGFAQRRLVVNAMLALAAVGCAALALWPPAQYGFYPACPIHVYLHLECPGCGATRALAALLHGRLSEAMRLNLLFVLLLPFGIAFALECYRRAMRQGEFRWPRMPAPAIYAALAAAGVFTVGRNLV